MLQCEQVIVALCLSYQSQENSLSHFGKKFFQVASIADFAVDVANVSCVVVVVVILLLVLRQPLQLTQGCECDFFVH